MDKWISEYIRQFKSKTNEYPNIFVLEKINKHLDEWIYSSKYIWIYLNIRIFVLSRQHPTWNWKYDPNIRPTLIDYCNKSTERRDSPHWVFLTLIIISRLQHFSAVQCSAVHCSALQCTALHCTALKCCSLEMIMSVRKTQWGESLRSVDLLQ